MAVPTFRSYASPPPHLAFSSSFFNYLTIAQAGERSYPLIAPIGSVISAKFLAEIPLSAAASVIIPSEVIPNYKDLKTLTSTFEEACKEGSRSACHPHHDKQNTSCNYFVFRSYARHFMLIAERGIVLSRDSRWN